MFILYLALNLLALGLNHLLGNRQALITYLKNEGCKISDILVGDIVRPAHATSDTRLAAFTKEYCKAR
jgi:hypothetical protein